MKSHTSRPGWLIILLLGSLSLITPISVDMYLPAFSRIAAQFHATTSAVSWSLSTYFIGFAFGQLLYGPLLDHFGRKRPIYAGLSLYLVASALCTHPGSLPLLIALRFLQAIGGCVAQVASVAMVRDFFPPGQSARILSLLFLIIGVSPLLAPTIGSMILLWLGWQWIFVALSCFTLASMSAIFFFLPEPHQPDTGIALAPRLIIQNLARILVQPQFCVYALAGAFSFAGLFAYVAGSPIIFMEGFHVTEKTFGLIFAVLTGGFIAGSQLNILLLRRFSSRGIFVVALCVQACIGIVFLTGASLGWYGLQTTSALFLLFLSCIGMTYPNAAAAALAPFSRNVGSASALLGFIQMGMGALVSTGIGFFGTSSVVALLAGTAMLAVGIFVFGRSFVPGLGRGIGYWCDCSGALMKYLVFLLSTVLYGFQQPDKDVYAIYSLMLTNPQTSHGPDTNPRYLIADTTVPGIPETPCISPITDRPGDFQQVLADFTKRKKIPRVLKRSLTIQKPYVLLNAEDAAAFVKSRMLPHVPTSPPQDQDNRFKDVTDLFRLGEVYFNQNRTLALASFSSWCGGLCGLWKWRLFEKLASGSWVEHDDAGCSTMARRTRGIREGPALPVARSALLRPSTGRQV